MVELVYLQRWYETYTASDRNFAEEFNLTKPRYFDDRVWVMIVVRNIDGTAERIAVTTIPYDSWVIAGPLPSIILVV